MSTHILYHKNCFDGTGAKYAAWTKFQDNAVYTPVQYGEALPSIPSGSDLYILDFSYPKDVLEALRQRCKSILVLDHHKTAEEALRGLPYARFDMNKSGAVLAWEHFNPGTPVPDLLLHIQDRDLWKWKLGNTEAVTKALPLLKNDMNGWAALAHSENLLEQYAQKGDVKTAFDNLHLESQLKSVVKGVLLFEGVQYVTGFINTTVLASEMGNKICTDLNCDIGLPYFISDKGDLVLSFRSLGDTDVSALAKFLGGGGHKNAAGARLALPALELLFKSEGNLVDLREFELYAK